MRALTPEAAATVMRQAGAEPTVPYPGCGVPWRCRCMKCDREVTPMYSNVKKGRAACAYCSGRFVDPAAAAAELVAAGLEPLVPFPGSDAPWESLCVDCGQQCSPTLSNIRRGQGGCRNCGNLRRRISRRLCADQASATMQAVGLDPLVPYPGANEAWPCQCRVCGKRSAPSLSNVTGRGDGCPWCSGHTVDPVEAGVFMLSAGLEPLAAYPGRHAPWLCRCQRCLRTVSPSYGNVRKGKGCRWCAKGGFTAADAAVVYLISHPTHHAAKVGITNSSDTRLSEHRRQGWQVLASVPMPGELAVAIEKDILRWWRSDLGLPPFLSAQEMPQRGWTETVDLDAVDILATIERIRILAANGLDRAA